MKNLFMSSANPEKISLTIKSIGAWIVTALVLLGATQEISGIENQLNTIVDELVNIVNTLFVLVSSVMSVYGVGRKIYYKFKK